MKRGKLKKRITGLIVVMSMIIGSITVLPKAVNAAEASLLNTYGSYLSRSGVCINSWQLNDNNTLNHVKSEYNSITLENEMKPDYLLNSWGANLISVQEAKNRGYYIPESYTDSNVPSINFSTVDSVMKKCYENGLGMRAHTLVWHSQMPEWFYRYARLIGERFGDRVKHFITINEPSNIIEGMTPNGTNAPALGYSLRDRLTAIHQILLSHGMAVKTLRETVSDAKIGIAPCSGVPCPPSDHPELIERARTSYFYLSPEDPKDSVTAWLDPIFFGEYPREYLDAFGALMPEIKPGDMELISQPIDFCFQNIYGGQNYRAGGEDGWEPDNDGITHNMLGWSVVPDALYWGTRFLYERYRKPVCIMENGYCSADTVGEDGCIHDPERCQFLTDYIGAILYRKAAMMAKMMFGSQRAMNGGRAPVCTNI